MRGRELEVAPFPMLLLCCHAACRDVRWRVLPHSFRRGLLFSKRAHLPLTPPAPLLFVPLFTRAPACAV
jgi:hypothetical protein